MVSLLGSLLTYPSPIDDCLLKCFIGDGVSIKLYKLYDDLLTWLALTGLYISSRITIYLIAPRRGIFISPFLDWLNTPKVLFLMILRGSIGVLSGEVLAGVTIFKLFIIGAGVFGLKPKFDRCGKGEPWLELIIFLIDIFGGSLTSSSIGVS